jgi:hypothetical protein
VSIQYSIISALIRPEIKEKISVGIIMFDNENTLLRYSIPKLNIAKELLSENGHKLLREVLKNIEYNVQISQPSYLKKRGFDFELENNHSSQVFSIEYVSYLSKYSNNSISFSEPKRIEMELSKDSLNLLFEKYVNDVKEIEPENKKKEEKLFNIISKKYKGRIDKMFDISKEVTHEIVPNLITPVTIDFSGRNGIDVYVQTLDMQQHTNFISNHINCLFQLKSIYSKNRIEMKDFIIAKEPPKTLIKQHDIWNQIRKQNIFDYVDFSETDRVIEYAEKKGVKPLSTIE